MDELEEKDVNSDGTKISTDKTDTISARTPHWVSMRNELIIDPEISLSSNDRYHQTTESLLEILEYSRTQLPHTHFLHLSRRVREGIISRLCRIPGRDECITAGQRQRYIELQTYDDENEPIKHGNISLQLFILLMTRIMEGEKIDNMYVLATKSRCIPTQICERHGMYLHSQRSRTGEMTVQPRECDGKTQRIICLNPKHVIYKKSKRAMRFFGTKEKHNARKTSNVERNCQSETAESTSVLGKLLSKFGHINDDTPDVNNKSRPLPIPSLLPLRSSSSLSTIECNSSQDNGLHQTNFIMADSSSSTFKYQRGIFIVDIPGWRIEDSELRVPLKEFTPLYIFDGQKIVQFEQKEKTPEKDCEEMQVDDTIEENDDKR